MLRQEFCQKFVCSVRSRDDDEGLKQQQQQQQSFPKDQPGLKNSEFDPRPKKKCTHRERVELAGNLNGDDDLGETGRKPIFYVSTQ